MRHSSKHHRLGRTSSFALAIALAVPAAVALPAVAQAQEAAQQFDIPAGDLSAALERYSAQTGMQLVYSSDLVAGKRSPGASGRMSPQQALGQLLAGSGLSARVSGNSATLVLAGASGDVAAAEGERLLGPVRVEGSQGGSYQPPVRGDGIAQLGGIRGRQDEEAVGYRARVASVATGAPIAIEDIPRSITVQTQEQIEKQDIDTLGEALQRLPGITLVEGPSGGNETKVFLRGYELSQVQVDGGAPRTLNLSGNGALNLDAYERIELVRGPNALFVGEGSQGGSLNLVRKRPGSEPRQSFSVSGGSFGRIGLTADTSTASFLGSLIGFRGVASLRREAGNVDHYSTRNALLYGIFDIPLGASARLEAGAQYVHQENEGSYAGVPRYTEGGLVELPVDFNAFSQRPRYVTETTELFSKLYVDIADDWDFEGGISYQRAAGHGYIGSQVLVLNKETQSSLFPTNLSLSEIRQNSTEQMSVDTKVNGRFLAFGLMHNFYAGFSYNQINSDIGVGATASDFCNAPINSLTDLQSPVFTCFGRAPGFENLFARSYSDQIGIVVGDTISWRDLISLTATVRRDEVYSAATTIGRNGRGTPTDATPSKYKPKWTPSYSLAIHPMKGSTLFVSYADGFSRQDNLYSRSGTGPDFTYQTLSPTRYKNYEVGAKFAGQSWLASLTAYRNKLVNSPAQDAANFNCPPQLTPDGYIGSCYFAVGNTGTSEGIDFEITGNLLSNLSIIANYNYNRTKVTSNLSDPGRPFDKVPFETRAPLGSGSIFAEWTPPFARGMSLRLGTRYRGRVYQAGNRQFYDENNQPVCRDPVNNPSCLESFEFAEKKYFIFDAGFDYRFDNGLTLRLNVENVANRKYLSTVSSSTSGSNFYGRPRSFMATLTWEEARSVLGNGRSASGVAFGVPGNWYGAFDFGWRPKSTLTATAEGKAQDGQTDVSWRHELTNGATGFARLGYYVSPRLRAELELQYKPSDIRNVGGAEAAPFGVCGIRFSTLQGEPFQCDDVHGRLQSYGAFGNIILDAAARESRLVPYLGIGAGITRDVISYAGKLEGIGGTTPWQNMFNNTDVARVSREAISAKDVSYSFAWQALAGLSYKLNKRLRLDATWRYSSSENVAWDSYNTGIGQPNANPTGITPRLGKFAGEHRTHAFSFGFRWQFGGSTN